jgi:hypothetical protein
MASTYTGLGVQLMATGEKAGTWGTLTNTNWNIIEQISGGYVEQAITSTPTTLAVSDGSTGATLAHRVIKFTGSIGENTVVTIPLDVQTFYIITNGSSGGYTVQFKYVSGSGSSVTWGTTDKGTKIIYAAGDDATNPNIVDVGMGTVTLTGTQTLTNKTLTSPKINEDVVCSSTATELNLLDGCTATTTELNYNDLTTLGTSAGSKVLSADSNNLTKITGAAYFEEDTLTFDATQDWDVRASPVAKVTLTANVIFDAPSNPTTGQFISILCIQDAGGSNTIGWNAVFEFAADTAPTATTTGDQGDLFSFRYNGAKWLEVGRTLNLTLA